MRPDNAVMNGEVAKLNLTREFSHLIFRTMRWSGLRASNGRPSPWYIALAPGTTAACHRSAF